MLIPHRGTLAVSFLPQIPAVFGCFLVRLAKVAQFYRHGIAAMAPQMRSGG